MEHNHDIENKFLIPRIICSLVFFVLGFFYVPFFLLAYLTAGYDILLIAVHNLYSHEIFDENFLMSIATIGALIINEYPEAVMVMILYQIGEYLQHKAIHKSTHSIEELMDLRPDFATINGKKCNPKDVKVGDIITVCPGEKVPLDGIIVEGTSSIDTSALTGESIPSTVSTGNDILSGTVCLNGYLKIKVTKKYEESTVNKILSLIKLSAEKKSKTENLITRFAKIYTPLVVIAAILIGFIGTIFSVQDTNIWIERALTFLVISCPCALVISVPLTFFAGIGGASAFGVLIKGSNYLEQFAKSKTIIFDKTGTLTTGNFTVKEINSENPMILKFAAIAENLSTHPLANAIKIYYKEDIPPATEVFEEAGKGISANYEGNKIKVGTASYIGVTPINSSGTVIYVSLNDEYIGNIVLADSLKNDTKETLDYLQKSGIKTSLFTGDTKENAEYIKKETGINEIYYKLLPADKVNKLEEVLKKGNTPITFVGDGINDAPVIKRADIGIAMGGLGSDAAIEASDIVIMDDKPSKLIKIRNISKKTVRIAKQNIAFALIVKFLFLLLSVVGLMTMWFAVFADVGVTIIAILNSLRARRG